MNRILINKTTFLIYKKELLEIFKDKKAVFMSIFFPVIIYPLLIFVSLFLGTKGQDKIEKVKTIVAIEKKVDKELIKLIKDDKNLTVIEISDYKKAIQNKDLDIYLEFKLNKVNVFYDSTNESSPLALERIEKVIDNYKETEQKKILKEKGIPEDFLLKYSMNQENLASQEKKSRHLVGILLPILLIFPLIGSIIYTALDLTSGEKERKTLETLLILPVKKESLMLAKLFATVTMGAFSAIINIIGLIFTSLIAAMNIPEVKEMIGNSLDVMLVLQLAVMLIPLIFFIAGLGLVVGLVSKDYKDAQNFITPITLLLILPIYFVINPGWNLTGIIKYIPVLNVFLFFKSIGIENVKFSSMFIVFLTNIGASVLVLIIFGKLFKSETLLLINEKGFNFSFKRIKASEKNGLEISEVILTFITVMILLTIVGGSIQLKYKEVGVFLTQILLILLPVILLVRFLNLDYKKLFIFKKPKLITSFNSISLWAFTFALVGALSVVQMKFFPGQMDDAEELAKFFKNVPIYKQIIFFCVTPAICEELFFRGLIFGSLRGKMKVRYAILVSGLLFGLFHIYPFKILSTGILGILFAYITWRTGSIIYSMSLHFLNNFFALIIAPHLEGLSKQPQYASVILIVVIILITNGISWLFKKEP